MTTNGTVKHFKAGAVAVGANALGAFAVGAFAIGALAISRLAIRRLAVRESHFDVLDVREFSIGRLRVKELVVTDNITMPANSGG